MRIAVMWWGVGLAILCGSRNAHGYPNPYRSRALVQRLYVANAGANSVTVYPLGKFGNVSPKTTNPALSGPNGVAVDASGNIYVANSADDSIIVYAASANGARNPVAIIKGAWTGMDYPIGVALDANGNIYVANQGFAPSKDMGSVTIYRRGSRGSAKPYATIAGPKTELRQPGGLALDSAGNIYVANSINQDLWSFNVTIYAAGSTGNIAPVRKISSDNGGVGAGVGFDPAGRFGARMTNFFGANLPVYAPTGIAVDTVGKIYVSSNDGTIQIIAAGAAGPSTPTATIQSGCIGSEPPSGVAVDAAGDIFTVSGASEDSTITVYSSYSLGREHNGCPLSAAVVNEGASGLAAPTGLALDSSGRIYVTNAKPNGVAVFPPLHPPPVHVPPPGAIVGTQIGQATSDPTIRDSSGCQEPAEVGEYPQPLQVISTETDPDMDRPQAVAFDERGMVYVANAGSIGRGSDYLAVYPAGSNTNMMPVATIDGNKTGLAAPVSVAVDRYGQIYAANTNGDLFNSVPASGTGSITIYARCANGNVAPLRTIGGAKTGLSNLVSLALDSAGNIYALSENAGPPGCATICGSVTVYAPDANGDAAPIRTIIGPRAGFDGPTALAVDRSGNIYVANQGSADGDGGVDAVTIYLAGSNGDVAPKARIAGPKTRLDMPSGVMVDATGNIYVANDNSPDGSADMITVYPPVSNGNVAPAMLFHGRLIRNAIIAGPATELDQPAGMAIGPGS